MIEIEKKYPIDVIITCIVSEVMPFGYFAKLEDEDVNNVIILIHLHNFENPNELVSIGDRISGQVAGYHNKEIYIKFASKK